MSSSSYRFLTAALGAVLLWSVVAAQSAAADVPVLRIGRIAAAPVIDDILAGRIDAGLTKVTGFVQRDPRDGDPVSRDTTAYIGYDDRSLHVVFVCREDPGGVRAHMTRREAIEGNDFVGVIVDTFHDRRHGYEFFANPLGVQMDGIATDGQNDDYSFDTLWQSEGRLTPDGYVVRLAIPFRSLRFKSADAQTWGIAFLRAIPARNETAFWPRLTRRVSSQMEQLARLDGLARISPGRNMQFIPYSAFTGSRYVDEEALSRGHRAEARVGLDAKVVLKDALTLDVALNPDFSQVESDEPQVTINQRFEVQFPEKRPFFIENASYFNTPEELFFSRRIADPRFGARLTGRLGKWTVAGLVMDDRAPGEEASETSGARGDATVVAVGRAVREFGRQSTAGVMVTSRDFGASSNRVASADIRLRLGDNWILNGQAIASKTTRLDGTTSSGPAFLAAAAYDSRTVRFESEYSDRSPGFASQVGFIPRNDVRLWETEGSYTFYPKGRRILSWGPGFDASVNWDRRNRVQDWELNPEIEFELPASTELHVSAEKSFELFDDIGFDKHEVRVFFETQRLGWLWVNGGVRAGRSINYYPVDIYQPFLADSRELELGVTLRPRPAARIDQTYIYNALTTDGGVLPCPVCSGEAGGMLAGRGARAPIYRLHLVRTKANYQFTRELSLRAILDYNVLNPNAAYVALDRDRRLTADVLVTYLLNPGTALYVGYTDAYANLLVDPTLPAAARRTDRASTSVGRQFFVKVSYLIRR